MGRKRKGRRQGAAGSCGCGGRPARQGEEERKGERERLTSGAQASVRAKEKEKERGCGPVRGEGRWAAGPFGPKGEKGEVFFLFFFQTSFKTTISFQIQIKTLSDFFSKIYRLFRNHTSNQKPCKPTDDAQSLVVSMFIKLYLIY
jgi:hypothetical protein